MHFSLESFYQLFLGAVLGALVGAERSFVKKQTGLRTFALVGLGATLFSLLASNFPLEGATRILANIVLGIGFLGAGVIFLSGDKLVGATTASALWVTAGIGLAVGQAFYTEAFITTALVLIILAVLTKFEDIIRGNKES
jgi:putative Mg2+ transporter-C (MgtC) family protein